jgi:hypothetical protein
MAEEEVRVSVIDPIGPAIDRVKAILFAPFDLGVWFVIGFCAWLANLGRGGFRGGFNVPTGGPHGDAGFGDISQKVQDITGIDIGLIIAIGAIVFVVAVAVAVVMLWLNSRGRFMFLHCVAQNKAQVKAPWNRYRRQGNSLFLFRLAAGLIFFICLAIAVVPIILLTTLLGSNGGIGIGIIGIIVVVLLILMPVAIIFAIILKFTRDLVAPIMYLRGCTCIEGWREFRRLLSGNAGRFTLYILFQIVIWMAKRAIIFAAVVATCCCAGVVLAIPYLGTVLMLPLLVFTRAYSLYYLAQYGGDLYVFAQAPLPEAALPQAP